MRMGRLAALGALLVGAGCADATGPVISSLEPQDAAFVAAAAPQIGALGDYLAPALQRLRTRDHTRADSSCAEMEQLRLRLRHRDQAGDSVGAALERYRLRLAAAWMIHAGLGTVPLDELLAGNEQLIQQLQLRIRTRTRLHQETTADGAQLRIMLQLQEQARLALQQGSHAEALELAARAREQWRLREYQG